MESSMSIMDVIVGSDQFETDGKNVWTGRHGAAAFLGMEVEEFNDLYIKGMLPGADDHDENSKPAWLLDELYDFMKKNLELRRLAWFSE